MPVLARLDRGPIGAGPNILITFGRKTGGGGGGVEYYTRPSLPILIMFKEEGVRIRVKKPRNRSEESILPGWESIPGLLNRFTNAGSVFFSLLLSPG